MKKVERELKNFLTTLEQIKPEVTGEMTEVYCSLRRKNTSVMEEVKGMEVLRQVIMSAIRETLARPGTFAFVSKCYKIWWAFQTPESLQSQIKLYCLRYWPITYRMVMDLHEKNPVPEEKEKLHNIVKNIVKQYEQVKEERYAKELIAPTYPSYENMNKSIKMGHEKVRNWMAEKARESRVIIKSRNKNPKTIIDNDRRIVEDYVNRPVCVYGSIEYDIARKANQKTKGAEEQLVKIYSIDIETGKKTTGVILEKSKAKIMIEQMNTEDSNILYYYR